jgi:hypothetical protein
MHGPAVAASDAAVESAHVFDVPELAVAASVAAVASAHAFDVPGLAVAASDAAVGSAHVSVHAANMPRCIVSSSGTQGSMLGPALSCVGSSLGAELGGLSAVGLWPLGQR